MYVVEIFFFSFCVHHHPHLHSKRPDERVFGFVDPVFFDDIIEMLSITGVAGYCPFIGY